MGSFALVRPRVASSNARRTRLAFLSEVREDAAASFLRFMEHPRSTFGSDRPNKLVNQFAGNRFRPLNCSRGDFWIQVRVRLSDLFGRHCWGSVRQFDSVVDELSLQAMQFHEDSFRG